MALHHRVIAASTSGQSHLIVAAVLLSFVVWVTLQGHLGAYLNDLGIGAKPKPAGPAGLSGPASTAGGGIAGGMFGTNSPFSLPTFPSFGGSLSGGGASP